MILKLEDERLIIVSGDAMDAAYLNHIFGNNIEFSREIIPRQEGFNYAGEQEVRITLSKVSE